MKKIFVTILLLATALFALEDLDNKPVSTIKLEKDAMCPVKYVPLEKHREWLGVVQFKDGSIVAISSPKYAFSYFYKNALTNEAGINALYLTDHKTKRLVKWVDAYYVFGSTVMSVGGDDLVPFRSEKDAEAFMKEHKGKKIYTDETTNLKRLAEYLHMR